MNILRIAWIIGASVMAGIAAGAKAQSPTQVLPPAPYGAIPTAQQVAHSQMAMYAFCHFNMNTFTNREWGTGGESPSLFTLKTFHANQIVRADKAGGFKGVILTCKHHDGFCLWPTKTTQHNIAYSPYDHGRGDIVRLMMEACHKAGMKFGVYVSPWDRNNGLYGTPAYVTKVFDRQVHELLSHYGPIFEIWFDGANGGSGYYGGKGGVRKINFSTYYDWPHIFAMIRKLQPQAIIYSDAGPDSRWVGNEGGSSPDPCYPTITFPPGAAPGHVNFSQLGSGMWGGKQWCPAEVDVSIRPGWFWHASQNMDVRSPANLMQIYMDSVGHGCTWNLNCPPNRNGRLSANDVLSLKEFGRHLRKTFAKNLAAGATLTASNIRGGDAADYGPQKLLDADPWSAWITDDQVHTPQLVLQLKGEKTFNLIRLREDIKLGLRVQGVAVDAWDQKKKTWHEIASTRCVGACHLWRVPLTTTDKVRIRVTQAPVCPALSDFGLFLEPKLPAWNPRR